MPTGTPVIPTDITVHLGAPTSAAQNVTVPFSSYIKNVASGEIYPTWPESALRANIYAIISFALNRIYTEYYRSQGYDFDITSVTAFDQSYAPDREIFENISRIVDEIFNNYIVRQGSVEPLFAQFCNGTTSKCNGLSQWGTVSLAENGLSSYEILQNYYGKDINIVTNAPVQDVTESYPGVPLKLGDTGNNVKVIQTELNRISQNYPAIPKIAEENGIFGVDTENAVRKFQEIFYLQNNGTVDKSTWYKIKRYYVGVKGLSELMSEGVTVEEASVPFTTTLAPGSSGPVVSILQYYLSVIAYFNPNLNFAAINGYYGPETETAVREFQSFYGLPVTGEVDVFTWDTITRIYLQILSSLEMGYSGQKAKLYPGYFLSYGMQGDDIIDLQTYLSVVRRNIPQIGNVEVTGIYDDQTKNAILNFQRLFGIPQTGAVGPVTWNAIAKEYDNIIENN